VFMGSIREQLQIFVRRFGLLNAACCDECCGQQVSMVQSHILFEVRRLGSPAMQRVAGELGMDVTTFSRQIKALEEKGLVCRDVSSEDRRVFLLGLTEQGRQVLERIDRFMDDRLQRVFSRMSPFEGEAVIRSLELLNDAIVAADQEGEVVCCK
jgi:DNA-binding MarR family transcriptional regulator